jgi:IPT/TIG domain
MKIKTNIVKLLAVLAILGSLVAIAAVPASAASGIVLNPTSGTVGASVTVNATGFAPSTILTARFDGAPMTTAPSTVTADTTGAVTFAVLIPTATGGTHTISVTDGVNTATASFTVLQKVVITSPASKSGPVGTSVAVSGSGFSGAGVTADVTIGGKALVSGVPVDNTGSFTGTGTVPQMGSGAATVSASDGAGNVADVTDTFTVTPKMTLTPASGLPGDEVMLTGNGWPVSSSVTVTFAGGSAVAVPTDSNGLINAAYTIPTAATAGVKTVTGTSGAVTATTTFTVVGRQLTLTPATGPKGTSVLVTGSNMTSGGTIAAAALTLGGAQWAAATINIDSSGTIFPTTLVVPSGAALGANTVQATDNGGLIAYGSFTVTKPTITLNPTTGAINSSLTITGAGWLSGATVTLTFSYTNTSGGAGSTSITTIPDGSGNIAAAITVPADTKAGTATVSASDTKTNSSDSASFTVPGAVISVNPAQGPVGTQVTVTGSGFAAYTAISVKIGNYQFLSQPLSDVFGTFTYTFTVPGVAPGSQSVTATDTSNTASAFFVVSTAGATVQSQTSGISSYIVRVWGYSGGTWYMYDPADAAGSNLATLTSGRGYWINVNASCTLIYGGYSYALSSGWNLIGWR